MPAFKDLTGNQYGKLQVVDRAPNQRSSRGKSKVMWNCLCECGETKVILGSGLKTGNTTSCGCVRKAMVSALNFKDLTGGRFGRLTVLHQDGKYEYKTGAHSRNKWKCICDCGNETSVPTLHLTTGNTTSCGCYQKERTTTHGLTVKKPWLPNQFKMPASHFTCITCNESKERTLEFFSKNASKADGFDPTCKKCLGQRSKKRRTKYGGLKETEVNSQIAKHFSLESEVKLGQYGTYDLYDPQTETLIEIKRAEIHAIASGVGQLLCYDLVMKAKHKILVTYSTEDDVSLLKIARELAEPQGIRVHHLKVGEGMIPKSSMALLESAIQVNR